MFRENGGVHDILSGNPDNFRPEAAYTDEERWLIGETKETCASVDERDSDAVRGLASKLLREIGGNDRLDGHAETMPIRYYLAPGRYETILVSIGMEKGKIGEADHLTLPGLRTIEESSRRLLELADLSEKALEVKEAIEECLNVNAKEYGSVRSAATRVLFAIGAKDPFDRPFRAKSLPTEWLLEPGRYEAVFASIEAEKKKIANAVKTADSQSATAIEASARELLELADEMTETLFRPEKVGWTRGNILTLENGIAVARKESDEALEILRAHGIDQIENERRRNAGEPYERVSIPDSGPVADAFDAYLRAVTAIRTKTAEIGDARDFLARYGVGTSKTEGQGVKDAPRGTQVGKTVPEEDPGERRS